MLKFRTEQDKQRYILELGEADPKLFLKRRTSLIKKLVSFAKSQRSKEAWRKSRFKYLTGIRRFHRSVAGKRFHRQLARFMLTRMTARDERYSAREPTLAAISSLRTHLYIESQYYAPIEEACAFSLLYEYAVPHLLRAEEKIYKCEDLSVDEEEIILRCTESSIFIKEAETFNPVCVDELKEKYESETLDDTEGLRELLFAVCGN